MSDQKLEDELTFLTETGQALAAIAEGYRYRIENTWLHSEGVIYVIVENPKDDGDGEENPYLVMKLVAERG